VLISGDGSNLQAIIDNSQNSCYEVCLVVSNKPDAFGLTRADNAAIATRVVDHKHFENRKAFDQALREAIDTANPDLVVLAGFMRILTEEFVQHYRGRIINIHPSLLPAYPGTNTHQRVLDAGESEHGVSVHFVTEELDGGPVIAHSSLLVDPGESAVDLAKRVAEKEHALYPQVVTWFAEQRLIMKDNKAELDGQVLPPNGIKVD